MYMISFYVPESHLDIVKNALFEKGAGHIGAYSHCAWQVLGEGQFKALEGSDPFVGQKNQIEKVAEYKVEIVCSSEHLTDVMAAFKNSHPYEQPAYQIIQLVSY